MLTLLPFASPSDQRSTFAAFDPLESTWVVSDLNSKYDLNRALMRTRDFLPGEAVLRVSELWKTLLARLRPDFQLVSREFATALISQALTESRHDWARAPGAAGTAYEYMAQLMPLLSNANGDEIAKAWFEQKPEAHGRWGRWYSLAQETWTKLMDEGLIAPPWVAGVLVNETNLYRAWDRPLVFDLGAEMSQVEADLIVGLSASVDVVVLKPDPPWAGEFARALQPYEIFDLHVSKTVAMATSDPEPKPVAVYRRFTTMSAEVKEAVAQARAWLDAGARPSDIAVVACDIEPYWPMLSAYLRVEGVPVQKDGVVRLHSFPDVATWLATLRLRSGDFSEADLELCLFNGARATGQQPHGLTFDRFRQLFGAVYGREDFARDADVVRLFQIELGRESMATRDEFIAWALKMARDDMDPPRLERLLRRLFSEAPEPTVLAVRLWIEALSQAAARSEAVISPGDPDGIAAINLISAESSPCDRMIILGLTESALRSGADTNVLFADVLSLAANYGVYLPHEDRGKLEFEVRWLVEGSGRELLLTVPETDFGGAIQAPAWLWVKGAATIDKASAPRPTRWDELQRASPQAIARERGWTPERAALLQDSILEDLAIKPLPKFGAGLPLRLSASAIEDYLKCPFIFAVKRLFGLSDLPNLDLDVDASARGRLMHALFERLAQEPFRSDRSSEEVAFALDQARDSVGTELADERLWPSVRARHVELGRRFLAHEQVWRTGFPQTKTAGTEVAVEGFVLASTGELSREAPVDEAGAPLPAYPFRGFIDRVDFDDQGFAAILDYKSSAFDLGSFGSWLQKDRLQLVLYAAAFERGLTPLAARPVANAAYYVAKSMNRDAGFKLRDADQGLFAIADRKHNQATAEQKAALYQGAAEKVRIAIGKMRAGEFGPEPKDLKACDACRWSTACRAHHLNS